MIVPGVQREPAAVKKHFVPSAEIHRRRIGRHADVTEVTRAVSCGNVHASGKRHSQMREVPADAPAFLMTFRGGAVSPGVVVSEFDSVMGVITDCLGALPAAFDAAKERPSQVGQLFGVAVAAGQQVGKNVARECRHIPLLGGWAYLIWQTTVLDDKIAADFQKS